MLSISLAFFIFQGYLYPFFSFSMQFWLDYVFLSLNGDLPDHVL